MAEKQEVSLVDLILMFGRGIKRGFVGLWQLFLKSLRISFVYFWIVIPIFALVMVAGWFLTTENRTEYRAEGIIAFAEENRLFITEEIAALNALRNNNPKEFEAKFGLKGKQIDQFLEFRTYPVIDYLNDSVPDLAVTKKAGSFVADSVNRVVQNMLQVRIYMKGTTDYQPYMQGLISYLDAQPHLRRIDTLSRARANERIEFCNTELDRLARFSEYDYFGGGEKKMTLKTSWGGDLKLESSRKNLYYEDMRNLIKEKNYLEVQQARRDSAVANTLSPYMKVSDFPRMWKLAIFAIIGAIIAVAVAFKANERLKKVKF